MRNARATWPPGACRLGLAALALFVAGAVGWRLTRRPGVSPPPVPEEADAVPDRLLRLAAAAPRPTPAEARAAPDGNADVRAGTSPAPPEGRPSRPPGHASDRIPYPPTETVVSDAEPAMPPIRGTERRHREAFRRQAALDPAGFAATAAARLDAEVPLAEKMAALLTAREVDPELADRLFAQALDPAREDARHRTAAVEYLLRQAPRDAAARRCLHASVFEEPRYPVDVRERVAHVLCAAAQPEAVEGMLAAVDGTGMPAGVRAAALRGFAASRDPKVREVLDSYARGRWWEPDAQVLTRGVDTAPEGE